MNGGDVDGRSIKVERARRNGGYQKTPGVCKYCISSTRTVLKQALTCCSIARYTDTQTSALLV
jgi:hypothetical protein